MRATVHQTPLPLPSTMSMVKFSLGTLKMKGLQLGGSCIRSVCLVLGVFLHLIRLLEDVSRQVVEQVTLEVEELRALP